MITIKPPTRSLESLKAIAASGSSGLARKAQAELRARTNEALAASLASQRDQKSDGSK